MRKLLLLLPALSLVSLTAIGETPEQKGLEIALEADRRDIGWSDMQADLEMILTNRQGDESRRKIRNRTLEIEADGDKSLTIFDQPADVKGTAFLSFTHSLEPDEQWLYLPALKRVKRISSSNKSGPFMGSEFAYEDISSQEVEKYSYRYLGDEEVEGMQTFRLERVPNYRKSGYVRQIVWIDQQHYRAVKAEFYDRKNALLKTLLWRDYSQYLEKYWRAGEMFMENHQTGKTTTLLWTNYSFRNGLSERDFDRNSLKRAK